MSTEPQQQEKMKITCSIPDTARKWNWGAFLLGPFWALGNRVWIGIISLIPLLFSTFAFITTFILHRPIFLYLAQILLMNEDNLIFIYVQICSSFYILCLLVLGLKGGSMSWENNLWADVEDYLNFQEGWIVWGFVLGPLVFISFILSTYLITYWSVHVLDSI